MTMTTKATKEPSTSALRMRRYRKRRRQGLQYIRIPLDVTEIDTLIRMGLLKEAERHDDEALRTAIMTILYQALDAAS